MGEVIVITSGKGGVGKTTTVANLGAGLAMQDKSVVLIDTDIGLRNLDVVMGLENRIVFDLVDVIEGRCNLKKALIKDRRCEKLFLLPASQTKDKNSVNPEQMIEVCAELKKEFDYVLVDCPAGIESGFKNAIAGADKAIIVTMPEVSSVRDADRIIGLLESAGLSNPRLIVNRIRTNMVRRGDMLDIRDIEDILAIKLIGMIPDDEQVIISTNKGEPVVIAEDSLAAKAYSNIVGRILGQEIPFINLNHQESFFEKIKNIFRK